jgi:DNA-binding MarR family transcriptional regulator
MEGVVRRRPRSKPGAKDKNDVEIRAAMGCTCMRLRRATRRVTQLYDQLLAPAGITAGQFGLLGRLYGARQQGRPALSIGAMAELHGMDPTTLNRNLKPLLAAGLVHDGHDPNDRRIRTVTLTDAGRDCLAAAMPLWQEAQHRLEAALGAEATHALNGLLDLSAAKLAV